MQTLIKIELIETNSDVIYYWLLQMYLLFYLLILMIINFVQRLEY